MKQRNSMLKRGVAMLLVLISLMMATIMTMAYVASRDNSSAIGENVANSAAARWAADTGLDLGVAILQTNTDWRSLQNNGNLLHDYPLSNAIINIDLVDQETGGIPQSTTQYLKVTSRAVVSGVEQRATATAFVPVQPGKVVDVDLSDFAVFVGNTLDMRTQSMITRWPMAPLSALGQRIALGTRSISASSIVLGDSAAAIDATVFTGPGASNGLISNAASPPLERVSLLDAIPLPSPPSSGVAAPLLPTSDLTQTGGTFTVTTNARNRTVELRNNAVRTIKGNLTIVSDQDYKINTGAKLLIEGRVRLVVFGNLIIDTGSIELKPNSMLSIYTRGSGAGQYVEIKDGYIGDLRANNVRDNTGKASYMDPQRISMFSMAPGGAGEWRIEANSVVKGSIFSPHPAKVRLLNSSAVYGRIAAKAVEMRDTAALFYDPALDAKTGFVNTKSPIYDVNGHIIDSIKNLASLDTSTLQLLADLSTVIVKSPTDPNAQISPLAGIIGTVLTVLPGDPTPRPVHVEYRIASYGTNMQDWEH